MFYLSRITPGAGYAAHVLPALPLIGLGFGLIFAPAINTATRVSHRATQVSRRRW